MPSTFFTEPPHSRWLIILYFFFGRLAGGCFFIASLLALTERAADRPPPRLVYPLPSDATLVGAVFLVSSASASIALLLLLGSRRVFLVGGLRALQRFDMIVLVLELLTLAALVVSLGSLARVWLNAWGALLVLGVVCLGIVVPLLLHARARTPLSSEARAAPLLWLR